MTVSRGLIISLGASVLGCSILFLYFRNRISAIENKVNVMFDLIQNHQQPVVEKSIPQKPNMTFTVSETNNNKIQISDDEDDEDDDYDSENDAFDSDDSAEVSDNEEETLNLQMGDNNNVPLNNVEQLGTVSLEKTQDKETNLDDVDSLDEINDSDDENENENQDNFNKEVSEDKNKEESENDEQDQDNSLDTQENNSVNSPVKVNINYKKLKVNELKSLAEERELTGYKSLKKTALIDLLLANE